MDGVRRSERDLRRARPAVRDPHREAARHRFGGQPLFKPRHTRLEPISYQERHAGQRALYEAVTEYVREGYNRAVREHKGHVGFLMILLQRLVTSSSRAIRVTLELRLDVLIAPGEQLMLFPELTDEEWVELNGQEQIDTLLTSRLNAFKNERAEVELLLETAKQTETAGADAKVEAGSIGCNRTKATPT